MRALMRYLEIHPRPASKLGIFKVAGTVINGRQFFSRYFASCLTDPQIMEA